MIKSLLKAIGGSLAEVVIRNGVDAMLSGQTVPVQQDTGEDEPAADIDFHDQVKIFHSTQAISWTKLPPYEEADLVTLGGYQAERTRIRNFRADHRAAFEDREKLKSLDQDELVECETHNIAIPRSLIRRRVDVELPPKRLDGIVVDASEGQVVGGKLRTIAGFWSRTARITYRCPSRIWHAEELEAIRARLLTMPEVLVHEINAIEASRYNDPVLFISHRWETPEHPDPDGHQLMRLKELKNCFMIYDYTSFPQITSSRVEVEGLLAILENMHHLLKNVVVLAGPEYIERGWCIYEYMVACLTKSIVCDEVQDARFVTLRNWVTTRQSPASNPFHDGHEARSANFISLAVLSAANELASLFPSANFSLERDRSTVKRLLLQSLKLALPSKRDHNPYVGESNHSSWSDEELALAFDASLPIPSLDTSPTGQLELPAFPAREDRSECRHRVENGIDGCSG